MIKSVLFLLIGIGIGYLLRKRKRIQTRLVLNSIIHNRFKNSQKMEINLDQFVNEVLTLVNRDTGDPIADATFDNETLESSDTSVFTADTDVNADGNIDIVPVAAGTATLTVTADVTYDDPNIGITTVNKSATIEVTVTAPPAGAINTDLIISFGAAQPIPE